MIDNCNAWRGMLSAHKDPAFYDCVDIRIFGAYNINGWTLHEFRIVICSLEAYDCPPRYINEYEILK